ncbi:unnamed protein product [Clavelina lepadiformis]|uniref:Mediator of RNA polymerase II transcription subunit 31 n=1 Tax=Clavelina lepadiformis TaxID=159417 RepID=A0ABP0FPF3_CLALP
MVFTAQQNTALEEEFRYNRYVSYYRKAELAIELDLSEQQIAQWFKDRRRKKRRYDDDAPEQCGEVSSSSIELAFASEIPDIFESGIIELQSATDVIPCDFSGISSSLQDPQTEKEAENQPHTSHDCTASPQDLESVSIATYQPTRVEVPNPNLADDRVRFQVELEFVQCLANPHYLNFLAQRGYFKERKFVNYLEYLRYWKKPEYVKYIKYPQCIYMLELLQYEQFRTELVTTPCAKFIEDQMLLQWQYYIRKRIRLQQRLMESIRQRNDQQMQPVDDD